MAKGLKHNMKRSNQGASLALTLLLFLICAALAATVLAASTVVAGRNANNLAASDQRYYSVTCAAQLLSDKLGQQDDGTGTGREIGPVITLKRTHTKTVTTTTTYEGANRKTRTSTSEGEYTAELFDSAGSEIDLGDGGGTLLAEAVSEAVLAGKPSGTTEAEYAWNWESARGASGVSLADFTIMPNTTGLSSKIDTNALEVVVGETVDPSGDIAFVLYSKNADANGNSYRYTFTLSADVQTNEYSSEEKDVSEQSATQRVETATITEVKETTFKWHASALSKAGDAA